MPRLNAKHELAAKHFSVHGEIARAWKEAGFKGAPKTQITTCPEFLDLVAKERHKLVNFLEVEQQINPESVVAEIAQMAFFSPHDLLNDDGTMKEISEMDPDTLASLSRFESKEVIDREGNKRVVRSVEIRADVKLKALQLLAEIQGIEKRIAPPKVRRRFKVPAADKRLIEASKEPNG